MKTIVLAGLLIINGIICGSEKGNNFSKQEYSQFELVTTESGEKVFSENPSPTKLQVFFPGGKDPFKAATYATLAQNNQNITN